MLILRCCCDSEVCSIKMCPEHSNVKATAGIYAEPLQRLARMFAALSATNEAILRTTAADELYQQVCDAALSGGNLIGAAILLHESGTNQLKFVAGRGGHSRPWSSPRWNG